MSVKTQTNEIVKIRNRGISCYSEHLSINLNISEQELGSVLHLVHI